MEIILMPDILTCIKYRKRRLRTSFISNVNDSMREFICRVATAVDLGFIASQGSGQLLQQGSIRVPKLTEKRALLNSCYNICFFCKASPDVTTEDVSIRWPY